MLERPNWELSLKPTQKPRSQGRDPDSLYTIYFFGIGKRFDLSPAETTLLCLIYGLSMKTGFCYASQEYLASVMNVSAQTINAMLQRLKDKNLIEPEAGRWRGKTMKWKPTPHATQNFNELRTKVGRKREW
jgi:DNA-binding MarR family transcriptional regulator